MRTLEGSRVIFWIRPPLDLDRAASRLLFFSPPFPPPLLLFSFLSSSSRLFLSSSSPLLLAPPSSSLLLSPSSSSWQLGAGVDDPHIEGKVSRRPFSSRSASWPTPEAKHATRTRAVLCSRVPLDCARRPSQPTSQTSTSTTSELGWARITTTKPFTTFKHHEHVDCFPPQTWPRLRAWTAPTCSQRAANVLTLHALQPSVLTLTCHDEPLLLRGSGRGARRQCRRDQKELPRTGAEIPSGQERWRRAGH